MGPTSGTSPEDEIAGGVAGEITVHLWAAAKAAAGTGTVPIPADTPLSLADVVERVLVGRPDGLAAVLAGCAVLVGDRSAGTQDRALVQVSPGETVEFLPPFAGG